MKINKKTWAIGLLFSLIIILFLIKTSDASFGGDMLGGNKCGLWMPPGTSFNTDTQQCDQCGMIGNIKGLVPCTEYSCHSLGVDCNFDEQTKTCTKQSQNDRRAPVIQDCIAKDLMTTNSYNIKKETRKCSVDGQVEAYSALAFYLTLDEAGVCSISDDPSFEFASAAPLVTDSGGLSRNQFFIYSTSSAELNCNGMCTFYVKCADFNSNVGDIYTLEFFVKEAPDRAPPMIAGYSLSNGAYIPLSTTKIDTFYLVAFDNEGVKECRYATSSTAGYNSAELMQCSDTVDMGVGGWKCTKNGGLTTPNNENKYYFKCKDVNNNVMPNWAEFKLLKVTNTLNVGITSPGADVSGLNNVLRIGVSGYDQGVSSCRYDIKWRAGGDIAELTPSTEMVRDSEGIYSAGLNLVNSGRYDIKVECVDGVGQTASAEHNFVYRNEPLKFTFNPGSGASASQNNYLDVGLTVTGGRSGQGNTWQCRYKKVELDADLSTISFNDLDKVLTKTSPQFYSVRFDSLISGVNRFYVMCEDFDARRNYYGEEYKINFNPAGLTVEESGNDDVIRTGNNYGADLYVVLSGGPDGDGSADCYYTDTYVHGIYDVFNVNNYKSDKFDKGNILDYSGKSSRVHTKTVRITPNIPNDFYVRCVDRYNGVIDVIKNSILYSPSSGGGGTTGCTSNSDCSSGKICSNGICVSSVITGVGPLNVLSAGPNGNIGNKNVKLYITLTGGANEFGKNLNCYYNSNYDPIFERSTGITLAEFNQFFNTNRLDQSELLDSSQTNNNVPGTRYYKMFNLINGNYTYYVACKDSADTVGEVRRIGFSISEDITPPIMQFYTEGSLFKVRLNERGSCLVKQGDSFVDMSADSDGVIHSTPVRTDKTYMIRCKDVWNNWYPGASDFITVVKNG